MKLATNKNPGMPHTVFAWLPVMIFDRETGFAHRVWMQRVTRKLVSIGGATLWAYSKL